MASERIQRRIDRLLDQIEDAADQLDWQAVRERSEAVLAYDPVHRAAESHGLNSCEKTPARMP
jgi:hypothetical protein